MSEKQPPQPDEVLSALPRSRPHRRSDKRAARNVADVAASTARAADQVARTTTSEEPSKTTRGAAAPKRTPTKRTPKKRTTMRQPAQPKGTPEARRAQPSARAGRPDLLGSAVQAAAEVAELGLSTSARVVRGIVSRLPRP